MKKMRRLLGFVLSFVFLFCSATQAFAFKADDTHSYVTEKGAEILIGTMGSTYSTFYSSSTIKTLKTYSQKPDEDENNNYNEWHFYNPNTGKNFNGGTTTALSKFTSHYNNAVSYYKNGDTTNAWKSLGRALHYLGDLNTPVHTNNQSLVDAGTGLLKHIAFEDKCQEIQADNVATMTTGSYTYYKNNTVTTIGKSSANMASDNFNAMKNGVSTAETGASNAIINAQKAISGILYKFTLDVNK